MVARLIPAFIITWSFQKVGRSIRLVLSKSQLNQVDLSFFPFCCSLLYNGGKKNPIWIKSYFYLLTDECSALHSVGLSLCIMEKMKYIYILVYFI